jgi:hypothetical protein
MALENQTWGRAPVSAELPAKLSIYLFASYGAQMLAAGTGATRIAMDNLEKVGDAAWIKSRLESRPAKVIRRD